MTLTPDEAQALHELRQIEDPDHDPGGSCWCCCVEEVCETQFADIPRGTTGQRPGGPTVRR